MTDCKLTFFIEDYFDGSIKKACKYELCKKVLTV